MSVKNHKPARFRHLRAYLLTWRILFRYLMLLVWRRLLPASKSQKLFAKAHVKTSREIVAALQELKGLFIKVGQTLSVMGNFLPESLTEGLESLQDAVPPHDFSEIKARFKHDFGKEPEELFASIDPTPIASASLAQVHVAHLKTGEKLALKVQYPNLEELTRKDLKVLRRIFSWLDFWMPDYKFKDVYDECQHVILNELDFELEAQSIARMTERYADHPEYVFPKVYQQYSSKTVLALEFIEGTKVTHVEKLKAAGVDVPGLCKKILNFYCEQIFVDGFYHADPHPGNIIITPEGKIAMIDFGAVAEVSPAMRQGLMEFVEGLIKKDARILSQSLKQMGFVSKSSDEETLDQVVEYFYSKMSGIKIENFSKLDVTKFHDLNDFVELKKMDISLRELMGLFVVPREWIILERTLLILAGLSAHLDETYNPMETVVPYVEEFLLGKDKNLNELMMAAGKDLILSYLNLPQQLNRTLKKIQKGDVSIKIKGLYQELRLIRRTFSSLTVTLMFGACGVLSYLYSQAGQTQQAERFEMGAYALGVVFLWTILRR